MKTNKKLDSFLSELLKEDNPAPYPTNMTDFRPVEAPINVSLDQEVDRYIIRYEKESIPTADTYEKHLGVDEKQAQVAQSAMPVSTGPQTQLESFLGELMEAEGDEEEPPAEDPTAAPEAPAADAGAVPTEPSQEEIFANDPNDPELADGENPQKPIMNTPQINLQDFARSMARLVNNYDALLNPKEVIINRAKEYIRTNYDQRTADEFSEIMSTNYSLSTLNDKREQENELPTAYTVGALSFEG